MKQENEHRVAPCNTVLNECIRLFYMRVEIILTNFINPSHRFVK